MNRLCSLPVEIIKLIIENLEYASEVNSLAQTCHHLSNIATIPYLYPRFAKVCSPKGLDRLVESDNVEALRRLVSDGADLESYRRYAQGSPTSESPIAVAASKGFADILQVFRDACGPHIAGWGDLNSAIDKGDLEVLRPFVQSDLSAELKEELLVYAACCGNLDSLKCMVDAGFDINPSTEFQTPLMMAARGSRLENVQFLLDAGADPNLSSTGPPIGGITTTTLYYAAIAQTPRSAEAVFRCLLDTGACLVGPGESETQALARLAFRGAEKMAKIIMDRGDFEANLASSSTEDRGCWLCVAVALGDEKLTGRLLELGCPSIGNKTWPAIQEATKRGHADIVKMLLDKAVKEGDADLQEVYPVAISSAIFENELSTLLTILDHGGESLLEMIAQGLLSTNTLLGKRQISAILVERGILKYVGETKRLDSVLRRAIQCGNYEFAIQIMLHFDLGPLYSLKGSYCTVFELAAEFGPVDGFKRIISLGIDLQPDNRKCLSALLRAGKGLHAAIIELFLDSGFSVNTSFPNVHLGNGFLEHFEPLIVRVARTKHLSPDDERRALSTVRLLLERNADIDRVNIQGKTALTMATRMHHTDIVKCLLSGGANPFHGIGTGASPLEMAIKHHQPELVKEFLEVAEARGYQYEGVLDLIPTEGISQMDWKERFFPRLNPSSLDEVYENMEDVQPAADLIVNGDHGNDDTEDSSQYPIYWDKFFITKEIRKFYWRSMHPVSEPTT